MTRLFASLFNFREEKKQLLFIVLACFLLAFLGARLFSLYNGGSIFIAGYQIHHFYFGTLFLAVGGIIGTLSERHGVRRGASAYIGVGLGLFADEIGLLLQCTTEVSRNCRYAFPNAYDFVGAIALMLLILIASTHQFDALANRWFEKLNKPVDIPPILSEKPSADAVRGNADKSGT